MNILKLIKKFIYYLLTSGTIIAISLVFLDYISLKFNYINFFAFFSSSFFIINLMQYNIVDKKNPNATRGFLIHSLFGVLVWIFLTSLIFILHIYNFSRNNINIIISLIIILIICFYTYYNMYLNF